MKLEIPTDGKRLYTDYLIDSHGIIYNSKNKKIKQRVRKNGYVECGLTLNHKQYYCLIHRLVMCTFSPIENMESFQVNHINGIKTDNCLTNLEWVTCDKNMRHARQLGLYDSCYCDKSVHAKYSNDKINAICKDIFITGLKSGQLRQKYNIPKHLVDDLRRGKSWKAIVLKYKKGSTTIERDNYLPLVE